MIRTVSEWLRRPPLLPLVTVVACSRSVREAGKPSDVSHAASDASAAATRHDGGSPSDGGACRIPTVAASSIGAVASGLGAEAGTPFSCGDVVSTIILETCVGSICHHAGPVQAAHLDLMSPCVADRLVGVASTCDGRLLVDPERPEQSFILDKLENDTPQCGVRMPFDNYLSAPDLACMQRWVYAIARER